MIERINEFNHSFKKFFITEEGLREGLEAYLPVLSEYKLESSEEVQELINNFTK